MHSLTLKASGANTSGILFKEIMRLIYLLMLSSLLMGCEGIVGGDGKVYSLSTKQPLDSVEVLLYLDGKPQQTAYSDSEGRFMGSQFVGCVPRCPDAKIELRKKGYNTVMLDFNGFWRKNKYSSQLRDSLVLFLTPTN